VRTTFGECFPPFPSQPSVLALLSRNVKVKLFKTIILPVVLYGSKTWPITLREQHHRLRVFENRVLRGIFGPKRDEVTGDWRELHRGELHDLYSSPDIIRMIKSRRVRWAGHVARMGEGRNVCRVLVGKPEGKRQLERPRRRGDKGSRWIINICHQSLSLDLNMEDTLPPTVLSRLILISSNET
jgi:hypothetical protein